MVHSIGFASSRVSRLLTPLLLGLAVGSVEAGGHSRTVVVQTTPVAVTQSNLVTVQPAGCHLFHHKQGFVTAAVATVNSPTTLQGFATPAPLQGFVMTPLQANTFNVSAVPATMTVSFVPQRTALPTSLSSGLSASNPFETSSGLLGAGDGTTNNDDLLLQSDPYYQTLSIRLGDPARVQALKDHLRARIARGLREDGGSTRRRNWGSFLWKIAVAFIKARFGIDLAALNQDGSTSLEKVVRDLLSEERLPASDPAGDDEDSGDRPVAPARPATSSGRPLRSGDPVIFRGTIEYDGAGVSPRKTRPVIRPDRDDDRGDGTDPRETGIDPEDRGRLAPKPR